MLRWLIRRYRNRRPWPFCWRSALEGLLLSWLLLVAISPFIVEGREALNRMRPIQLVVLAVVLAPVIETIVFQVLPIHLCRWLRCRFWLQVVISTGLFAAAHFHESVTVGLAAGLVGGVYLAFTYAFWAHHRGWWTACWTTALHHAIRNGISIALLLAGR